MLYKLLVSSITLGYATRSKVGNIILKEQLPVSVYHCYGGSGSSILNKREAEIVTLCNCRGSHTEVRKHCIKVQFYRNTCTSREYLYFCTTPPSSRQSVNSKAIRCALDKGHKRPKRSCKKTHKMGFQKSTELIHNIEDF